MRRDGAACREVSGNGCHEISPESHQGRLGGGVCTEKLLQEGRRPRVVEEQDLAILAEGEG